MIYTPEYLILVHHGRHPGCAELYLRTLCAKILGLTVGNANCTPGVQKYNCTPICFTPVTTAVSLAFPVGHLVETLDFGGLGRSGIRVLGDSSRRLIRLYTQGQSGGLRSGLSQGAKRELGGGVQGFCDYGSSTTQGVARHAHSMMMVTLVRAINASKRRLITPHMSTASVAFSGPSRNRLMSGI